MINPSERHSGLRIWGLPLLVALAAGSLVLFTCSSAGQHTAPGVTLDEPFNVGEGVRLVTVYPDFVRGRLTLLEAFGDHDDWKDRKRPPVGTHLSDHPPLGRVWLGLAGEIATRSGFCEGSGVSDGICSVRTGSAVAFAITVFLVGLFAGRWWGATAGVFAAISLATMPRVFGHAHLASLETVMNLTFTAAVLSVAAFWTDKPPRPRTAALTGVLFGLALLTKIQAVLIPIPVVMWALCRYRRQAVVPLAIWGIVGFAFFFAGWPWLWIDPLHHPLEYFRRSSERVILHTYYLGERFRDRDVPWHYPLVMFGVTVPVAWLILGGIGAFGSPHAKKHGEESASDEKQYQLSKWAVWQILATVAFPLILFAIPGIVVYDGVRLFLVVFPILAVFIGRGSSLCAEWLAKRFSRRLAFTAGVVAVTIPVAAMFSLRPCYLSYYNGLTAGLWGAEKLGFEPNYWGDSVTPEFLDEVVAKVPPGAVIDVTPVMHSFQVTVLQQQMANRLERTPITLRAYDPPNNGPSKFVLMFQRRADLTPELQTLPADAEIVAEIRRQGVLLAALVRFRR